jgi:hypothetical protein
MHLDPRPPVRDQLGLASAAVAGSVGVGGVGALGRNAVHSVRSVMRAVSHQEDPEPMALTDCPGDLWIDLCARLDGEEVTTLAIPRDAHRPRIQPR